MALSAPPQDKERTGAKRENSWANAITDSAYNFYYHYVQYVIGVVLAMRKRSVFLQQYSIL